MQLGDSVIDFSLPDTSGSNVSSHDFADSKVLVVMFICNHCPYVKHVAPMLAKVAKEYQVKGVAFVAINSNDPTFHPDDSPQMMVAEVKSRGYTFPYLFDETQQVAKDYGAIATPDTFIFDQDRKLVYRGQLDSSRPSNGEASGEDLTTALDALLAGNKVNPDQHPSVGCGIKWRPGNEPS